ncbi:NADH:flavin oxidoreductase [Aurantivibrio infirmus]
MANDVLFKPFESSKLQLKNRIVMAPMTRGFSPNGVPGDNVVEYYRRRAAGGVGLIISEGTTINHPSATDNTNYPKYWGEESLAGWKKVIDAVHKEGGKMVPQIWHLGSMRKPGTGHEPDAVTASPSGLVARGKKKLPALSVEEIEKLILAYAEAALSAKELGFDGVEIHGAHGYLVDTFFWDGTNERDDKYGGSIEKRTQFGVEIVKKIRELCGEDFPIILRYSQWTQTDFEAKLAETPEELERFLKPLSDAGVDIFHCSTRRFWEPEFEGSTLNLAGWTKKITGKPCISVGSVGLNQEFIATYSGGEAEVASLDNLIERMEAEEFDLIAVGRALIANPDWPAVVQAGDMTKLKSFDKEQLGELV